MRITKKWLENVNACGEAIEEFEKDWPKQIEGVSAVKRLIKENKLDWANWLIVRLMKYKQYVAYAIYAAEQVIGTHEKEYPEDKRPPEAIAAAKKCLKNPTKKNRDAAYAAAYAAYAAYVAYAAAHAADAAAHAADTALQISAKERKKMQTKILKYGLKLLRGEK